MKLTYTHLLLSIMILTIVGVLTACEYDNDAGMQPSSDAAATVQENSKTNIFTQSSSQSGNSNSTQGVWVTIADGSDSGGDTNFPLRNAPTSTVNAANYLREDGTYFINGNLFSNCNDLGYFLLFQSESESVLVTNCGTEAFP